VLRVAGVMETMKQHIIVFMCVEIKRCEVSAEMAERSQVLLNRWYQLQDDVEEFLRDTKWSDA
jgi:hypothetical protein